MEADVTRGQKTGHFLDQRDNRALVRSMAADADVLDVFASTGGFSVAAAAGGGQVGRPHFAQVLVANHQSLYDILALLAALKNYGFVETVVFGIGSGIGFTLAIVTVIIELLFGA